MSPYKILQSLPTHSTKLPDIKVDYSQSHATHHITVAHRNQLFTEYSAYFIAHRNQLFTEYSALFFSFFFFGGGGGVLLPGLSMLGGGGGGGGTHPVNVADVFLGPV